MSKIDDLLSHEMTRGEFIKASFVGLLAVFGAANFLMYFQEYLKRSQGAQQPSNDKVTKGFGSSKFGI